jgi:hypothetical protein
MVVDMDVVGSPRMRRRPLAMMLERELVLIVGGNFNHGSLLAGFGQS